MIILDQQLQLSAQQRFQQHEQSQLRLQKFHNGHLQAERIESHQSSQGSMHSSSLRISGKEGDSGFFNDRTQPFQQNKHGTQLVNKAQEFIQSGQQRLRDLGTSPFETQTAGTTQAVSDASKGQLPPQLVEMIEAVEAMMERLTGKPFKLQVYGYHPEGRDQEAKPNNLSLKNASPAVAQNGESVIGEGIRFNMSQHFSETESMRFQAQGHIKTADGREIDFSLSTIQSREFHSSSSLSFQEGAVPTDPLVVNFGGQPAQMSLSKIELDLDNDGSMDKVTAMQSGSGFLALDKNADGKISQGIELFGTQSGNGFKDLSGYDADGNGWIDEGDPVFSELLIYHQDSNGLMQLDGLMELNIGAISINSVASEFSHKDANNQLQAQVRSSGVFLFEDSGKAGSVQQIDLVI